MKGLKKGLTNGTGKGLTKGLAFLALTIVIVLFAPQFVGGMNTNVYAKSKADNKVIKLEVGEKISLKINGKIKKASWKSSDKKVARVNKSGTVTAKNKGGAVITAKVNNTKYKCRIRVENKKVPQTASVNNNETHPYGVNEVLNLVNEIRINNGLKPLILDSQLNSAAHVRAIECGELYSHTRPNGTSCFTAFDEAGIDDWKNRGENLAEDFTTAEEVVSAWMNSPAHRKNILNKDYEYIGIAFVQVNGHSYWAQEFLTR